MAKLIKVRKYLYKQLKKYFSDFRNFSDDYRKLQDQLQNVKSDLVKTKREREIKYKQLFCLNELKKSVYEREKQLFETSVKLSVKHRDLMESQLKFIEDFNQMLDQKKSINREESLLNESYINAVDKERQLLGQYPTIFNEMEEQIISNEKSNSKNGLRYKKWLFLGLICFSVYFVWDYQKNKKVKEEIEEQIERRKQTEKETENSNLIMTVIKAIGRPFSWIWPF